MDPMDNSQVAIVLDVWNSAENSEMPKLFVFVLEISAPSTRIHCHEKYQIQVPKTEVLNLVSGCFGAELSLKRCAHTASVSEDSSILAGQIITTKPPGTVTFYEGNPPRVSRTPRLPGFTLEPPNTGADRMTVREYTREKPLNAGLGIYTVWLYWVFPEMVGKISQIIHFSFGFP